MSARITKAEVAFLMPPPRSPIAERAAALRQAASRAQGARLKVAIRNVLALLGRLFGLSPESRAIAALNGLTDRELADLGLTRGEIEAAVTGHRR